MCRGERNNRVCLYSDEASPEHRPGFLQKLANFTMAVASHVAAGMPLATTEQKNARLVICQACEHFENGGCWKCGCSMDMKAGWTDQSCPLEPPKWGPLPADSHLV